jgi:hypothetical protein
MAPSSKLIIQNFPTEKFLIILNWANFYFFYFLENRELNL